MRTRVVFTAITLAVAGVLGTAAGLLLDDFAHAFVIVTVMVLGVLTIGLLEWDHSTPAESPRPVADGELGTASLEQPATEQTSAGSLA